MFVVGWYVIVVLKWCCSGERIFVFMMLFYFMDYLICVMEVWLLLIWMLFGFVGIFIFLGIR